MMNLIMIVLFLIEEGMVEERHDRVYFCFVMLIFGFGVLLITCLCVLWLAFILMICFLFLFSVFCSGRWVFLMFDYLMILSVSGI